MFRNNNKTEWVDFLKLNLKNDLWILTTYLLFGNKIIKIKYYNMCKTSVNAKKAKILSFLTLENSNIQWKKQACLIWF